MLPKPLLDVGEHCVECSVSVARGSGNYVDRIPASNETKGGYLCSTCQLIDCDRCNEPTLEPNTIESDEGAEHVCDDCLTPEESEALDA